MSTPNPHLRSPTSPSPLPRPRRRTPSPSPSVHSPDRKRHRSNPRAYPPHNPSSHSYDSYRRPVPHSQSHKRLPYPPRPSPRYENGFTNNPHNPPLSRPGAFPPIAPNAKSRRLYIGNIPFQAGLTDIAMTQFFSALYVAGFGPNRKGQILPVISFWLHADGKFGFMELRGEQEAVNMMQFNGVFLHGRPLRVNRPSDYRPEVHNPAGMGLVPESVNIQAVVLLCGQLGEIVGPPAQLAAVAEAQSLQGDGGNKGSDVNGHGFNGKTVGNGGVGGGGGDGGGGDSAGGDVEAVKVKSDKGLEEKHKMEGGESGSLRKVETVKESTGEKEKGGEKVKSNYQCIIWLRNLVTDEDLKGDDEEFDDLVTDIRGECGSHGDVKDVIVPRTGAWAGSVVVQYAHREDAARAIEDLRTKVFDGRKIHAIFMNGYDTAAEAIDRSPPK